MSDKIRNESQKIYPIIVLILYFTIVFILKQWFAPLFHEVHCRRLEKVDCREKRNTLLIQNSRIKTHVKEMSDDLKK